jgi:hypothetical protein
MGAHHVSFHDDPKLSPEAAQRGYKRGITFAVVGLVIAGIGAAISGDPVHEFLYGWLTSVWYWTSLTVGMLFFVVIHHVTRAQWSSGLRRIAENFAANAPIMALLFIPILAGMGSIYHWTHADVVAQDPILQWKSGYLNTGFFIVRAVLYFAVWTWLALTFRKNSVAQDANGDAQLTYKMRRLSPVATILVALTLTFAAFDWMMSIDPHWFSTMFGVYSFAGAMICTYATLALAGLWLQNNGALKSTLTVGNFHDLGKMMFGFVCFWAYTAFSQYMLIWYANIPEETAWFLARKSYGWENIFYLLVFGHFLVPFWLLMSRHIKRNKLLLTIGCVWMLVIHFVDLYLVVMPAQPVRGHHLFLNLSAVGSFIAIGGVWFAFFAKRFVDDAAVAHKDPQLVASMSYDNF